MESAPVGDKSVEGQGYDTCHLMIVIFVSRTGYRPVGTGVLKISHRILLDFEC